MFKPLKETNPQTISANILKRVVRGPFYLLGFVLLFCSTSMIFVALFTNNWQRTSSKLVKDEFYSFGLWFTCRHVKLSWIKDHQDIYCATSDFSACKIFIFRLHLRFFFKPYFFQKSLGYMQVN